MCCECFEQLQKDPWSIPINALLFVLIEKWHIKAPKSQRLVRYSYAANALCNWSAHSQCMLLPAFAMQLCKWMNCTLVPVFPLNSQSHTQLFRLWTINTWCNKTLSVYQKPGIMKDILQHQYSIYNVWFRNRQWYNLPPIQQLIFLSPLYLVFNF